MRKLPIALAFGALFLAAAMPARAGDALEQRRRCFAAQKEEAVQACGLALQAGLPSRAAAVVRQVLSATLVELGRFPEAVALARAAVRSAPGDAAAQLELGAALVHFAGAADDALAPLQEAVRLRPDDPRAYGELSLALSRLGQHAEAVAAFGEAERLDPTYFDDRPAARETYEGSKRSEMWPSDELGRRAPE